MQVEERTLTEDGVGDLATFYELAVGAHLNNIVD